MKFSFKNSKNINSVNSNALLIFLTEESVKHIVDNNICKCGSNCDCGDDCECKKNIVYKAISEFDFKGSVNETVLTGVKDNSFNNFILIGLGKKKLINEAKAQNIGYKAFNYLKSLKIKSASFIFDKNIDEQGNFVSLENFNNKDYIPLYSSLIFGFSFGEYSFDKYFTGEKLKAKILKLENIDFLSDNSYELEKIFEENKIIKENVFFCRNLVNEPGNVIYPESVVKIVKEFTKFGIEVEVLKSKDMEKLGMNSLLAVGQGSERESYLVVLKWNGADKNEKPLAFVGKGVTFDSGGLSLKPSNAMTDMKCDMAGSAVVASLLRLLAMRKAKVNAIGIMGLVENMPSGNSFRVDDVIRSMSGQTIEVRNTDAEGRMVLADALYYTATKFNPELIIDLATLTGAMCIALGQKYAGLFTNNSQLSKELELSGQKTDETVWRMPISELGGYYDKQVDSDVADIRNTGKTRDAGSITAAQFLQRFINNHPKWAHIDIAGTAFVAESGFMTSKHATGFGVRLLDQFVKNNYEK